MTGGATLNDRYLGYRTKRYGATYDGHDVELEFDKRRVVLNEARLVVDGEVVDKAKIFYGDKNLTATGAGRHGDRGCGGLGDGRRADPCTAPPRGWLLDRPGGARAEVLNRRRRTVSSCEVACQAIALLERP